MPFQNLLSAKIVTVRPEEARFLRRLEGQAAALTVLRDGAKRAPPQDERLLSLGGCVLDIKPEMHDITILHHVFLAF